MNYKRLMKNSKAISPIFATLILIAIAVIAGVVVYMFTSGTLATMTAGGTAGQEKVTVQGASISKGGNTIIYLEQTGGPAASLNSIIFKDASGNTLGDVAAVNANIAPAVTGTTLASGTMYTITVSTTTVASSITVGSSYTLTVTTAAGGSFVSPSVVATT